jgi:hypothetical protein
VHHEIELSQQQGSIISSAINRRIFLQGPAGCGKTTAAVHRLKFLIESGVQAEHILILAPQRSLTIPYQDLLIDPSFPQGGLPTVITMGGLAQRMIDLFWPIVAHAAGFARPQDPPVFLTMESAQYFLDLLIEPVLAKGYFANLVISRPRLCSQILDGLNKTALTGTAYDSFSSRLKDAWIGESSQQIAYDQAQEVASLFRQYCKQNNLLDYSLQMELFTQYLWPSFLIQKYLKRRYSHLIFDNIEEDCPIVHDIIKTWLPEFHSALLIFDENAGIRTFLGADPASAYDLKNFCDERRTFSDSFVESQNLMLFEHLLCSEISHEKNGDITSEAFSDIKMATYRFVPEMVQAVTSEVCNCIKNEGYEAEDVAIVAPYMNDSLRFALMTSLQQAGIPTQSHRPSRSLRDEPATNCMLTYAKIAHPQWRMKPSRFDIRTAYMQTLTNGDLVRADLLAQICQPRSNEKLTIGSFQKIIPQMQDRITFSIGNRYETLREWLLDYEKHPVNELDVFISLLFGEVLSQPGFGFHDSYGSASVIAKLTESIQKFRKVISRCPQAENFDASREYIRMVEKGILAASYLEHQDTTPVRGVTLAPAHSFLLQNRSVKMQFWLDVSSLGWSKRPNQPLTHPYVLSRHWQPGDKWTDAHELAASRKALLNVVTGLTRRCRQNIVLCSLAMNERGTEERGLLITALQHMYRKIAALETPDV